MTVETTATTSQLYPTDGARNVWPFYFRVNDLASLRLVIVRDNKETVIRDGLGLRLQGLPASSGEVVYPPDGQPAIPAGARVYVKREVDFVQRSRFGNQGAFSPQTFEDALDYVVMGLQQVGAAGLVRALQFPSYEEGFATVLPPANERAGKVVGFGLSGELLLSAPQAGGGSGGGGDDGGISGPIAISDVTGLLEALDATEKRSQRNVAGGIATLDGNRWVPSGNLPPARPNFPGVTLLVNALNSTSATAALTAAQGKVLDERKANKGSTLADYNIGDAYTKAQTNAAIQAAVDAGGNGEGGTSDTPQSILEKLKTVDGDGSGLDAELLAGVPKSGFALLGFDGKVPQENLPAGVSTVATLSALASLPPAAGAAILTMPGREGIFCWRSGDFSGSVDADPLRGVFVASSTIADTDGAWVRELPVGEQGFDPDWFGADPARGRDSGPAFQAAINLGKALAGRCVLRIGRGDYRFDTRVTATEMDLAVFGSGREITRLWSYNTNGVLDFQDNNINNVQSGGHAMLLDMRDMTFVAANDGSNGVVRGTAIRGSWPGPNNRTPACPTAGIYNVNFRSENYVARPATHGHWRGCIELVNAQAADIANIAILQVDNTLLNSAGIWINNSPGARCFAVSARQIKSQGMYHSVRINGWVENVHIEPEELVSAWYGVYADCTDSAIDSPNSCNPVIQIRGGHINARKNHIHLKHWKDVWIDGIDLYKGLGNGFDEPGHILVLDECYFLNISNLKFNFLEKASEPYWSVYCNNIWKAAFSNCLVEGGYNGVIFNGTGYDISWSGDIRSNQRYAGGFGMFVGSGYQNVTVRGEIVGWRVGISAGTGSVFYGDAWIHDNGAPYAGNLSAGPSRSGGGSGGASSRGARFGKTSGQSLSANAANLITWPSTLQADNPGDTMEDGVFTVPESGVWAMVATVNLGSGSSNTQGTISVQKNATTGAPIQAAQMYLSSGSPGTLHVSTLCWCNAGDKLAISCNPGTSARTVSAGGSTQVEVRRVA